METATPSFLFPIIFILLLTVMGIDIKLELAWIDTIDSERYPRLLNTTINEINRASYCQKIYVY